MCGEAVKIHRGADDASLVAKLRRIPLISSKQTSAFVQRCVLHFWNLSIISGQNTFSGGGENGAGSTTF